MNWADWTILTILLVSSLISLKRGFIKEALSLACWVAAFVIAMLFREPLSYLLTDSISTPSLRDIAAFAILFIATLLVGGLVNFLLGELVKFTGLSGTDRLLGMLFGALRGFILIMAILLLIPAVVPIDRDPWWQQSVLIPKFLQFESLSREVAQSVMDFIRGLFSSIESVTDAQQR
ncbi:CvpA family protein [Marinibactrum halimedae]|uniref:CvpA family protein n=1 Tax=Marinibactrum halimedae TaxID=1444977 RepID=A0AA37T6H4_9GAMM|nr:CvpA family protein [Marinibactrum halimedae]MCD9460762.1 CvpA family protein [Marinibactrum halimedae]GLS26664.1 hypothetical protein GCM10007877_23810 [Marinibactrum halimedae]